MKYTIEKVQIKNLNEELLNFFFYAMKKVDVMYGSKFSGVKKLTIVRFVKHDRVTLCRRDGKPVGFMIARLGTNVFDPSVVMLHQELLYAEPRTRAAKLLLEDFIDFGKHNANHIHTTIATHTNIKPQTLQRLGFVETMKIYRMETKSV